MGINHVVVFPSELQEDHIMDSVCTVDQKINADKQHTSNRATAGIHDQPG